MRMERKISSEKAMPDAFLMAAILLRIHALFAGAIAENAVLAWSCWLGTECPVWL